MLNWVREMRRGQPEAEESAEGSMLQEVKVGWPQDELGLEWGGAAWEQAFPLGDQGHSAVPWDRRPALPLLGLIHTQGVGASVSSCNIH